MTEQSLSSTSTTKPDCRSEHAYRGISYLTYEGQPHGPEYAHHQMRLLCRIGREAMQGGIEAAKAFAVIKETILALCEERIGQKFLRHNVILMDDTIFHIRKAIAHLPVHVDLRKEFGVKDRQALEDVLLGMEYYVTGEMDPRDMVAELVALTQD